MGLNISNNISLYRKCISIYNMYIKGLNSPIKRRKKIWKENNRLGLKQNPAISCLQVNLPPSSVPSHLVNPPKATLLPVSHVRLGFLYPWECVCVHACAPSCMCKCTCMYLDMCVLKNLNKLKI